MNRDHPTASYQVIADAGGLRFRFFCQLSGAVLCETEPIRAPSPEEALRIAWETQGRRHFNYCHKCGRWVSDVMYNADELQCVHCAPWRTDQHFCTACGGPLQPGETRCPRCGASVFRGRCG